MIFFYLKKLLIMSCNSKSVELKNCSSVCMRFQKFCFIYIFETSIYVVHYFILVYKINYLFCNLNTLMIFFCFPKKLLIMSCNSKSFELQARSSICLRFKKFSFVHIFATNMCVMHYFKLVYRINCVLQ